MASTYVNDLRLNELGTGDASGTWGTITNLNLELIGEGLSYGTQDCFASNADATTTVADGASDPARAMYFKVTSSATLTATRTLTIAPNTVSRLQFIENATTGGQSINISQGSGANVTIPSGATKAVYLDGAGSGAAVTDAFADLNVGTIDATTLQIGGTSITATATELNYNDISTLGQVQASKTVTADSSGRVNFGDNEKIRFGDGNDMVIYHDGSNSYIEESGDGNLTLLGTHLRLGNTGHTQNYFAGTNNGASQVYYAGVVKLATKTDGVDITGELQCDTLDVDGNADISGQLTMGGNVNLQDNDYLQLGASQDLQIYHDGTNSYIKDNGAGNLLIQGNGAAVVIEDTSGNNNVVAYPNGATTLSYANASKLTTKSDGVDITGELQSDSLDVDGVANISGRITATDGVEIPDNKNLYLGAGQDLVIFHDGVGGGSYINESGSGNLFITGTNILLKNTGSTATYASFTNAGAVALYYNGGIKLTTKSDGVDIDGNLNAVDNVYVANAIYHEGDTDTYMQFHAQNAWRVVTGNTQMLEVNDNYVLLGANSVPSVQTTNVASSISPNMNTYNSFVLTLTGNINVTNPSTEFTGMSGVFVFIQDGTGSRTVSLGTDYETAGGAGLTLSTAANAVDIVPYFVQSSGNILLGTPQLAFS